MKTLAEVKRSIKVGDRFRIINKLKNIDEVRSVTKVRTNGLSSYSPTTQNIDGLGCEVRLDWQRARDTRINEDGTIDFLLERDRNKDVPWEVVSYHTHPEQYGIDTDWWLKLELIN